MAVVVLMEAGPIEPGTNELVHGIAAKARLSALEQRLAALETDRDRGQS